MWWGVGVDGLHQSGKQLEEGDWGCAVWEAWAEEMSGSEESGSSVQGSGVSVLGRVFDSNLMILYDDGLYISNYLSRLCFQKTLSGFEPCYTRRPGISKVNFMFKSFFILSKCLDLSNGRPSSCSANMDIEKRVPPNIERSVCA